MNLPMSDTTPAERLILRKLRVWIVALGVTCLMMGVGIGVLLTGRTANAQNEGQIARAPEALSASFAEIARRVEPAVVNIDTVSLPESTRRSDDDESEGDADDDKPSAQNAPGTPRSDNPLAELFRQRRQPAPRGVGSGFIVDAGGTIITNYHVVEGASRIKVRLQSGEELIGSVVGTDEETDIAVIRVKTSRELPIVKLGNSDKAEVGDWVLAVGSPFGLAQTVTAGIISTKERPSISSSLVRFIQTDAAINRGNSGGPLVNMAGEVIGVNSQIATTTGDYNGIGFALPANEIAFVYRKLLTDGKVQRGYLGVILESVKADYARLYGLAEAKGAIVKSIREDAPAAQAGLQAGDIITEFGGQAVASSQDLISKVASTTVGQSVPVTYLRDMPTAGGKLERRTASIRVGERPPPASAQPTPRPSAPKIIQPGAKPDDNANRPRLGIKLSELTTQLAADNNLRGARGLLIRDVEPGSLADDADLEPKMVIERINRTPVTTIADFERVVNNLKPGDIIVLTVATHEQGRIIENIVQFTFQ